MDQAQRQLLEQVLRRFHAGLKTFQLYSPSHASAQATVQDLGTGLRGYLQHYGAVALQVNRDSLLAGDLTLRDGGMNALAFHLYARNLSSLGILPGLDDREVAALLAVLSQDRRSIEASGGVEHLILRLDLPHVVVKALALKEDVDGLSEASLVDALTRTRRLSPEQRDVVLAMLRAGPAQAASLLASVQRRGGEAVGEAGRVDVESLLAALETLDRTILDEPVEDQEPLLTSLAQGVLQLDERIRAALAPELVLQAVEGGSGRALLTELTGQDIALLMLGPVAHSEIAGRLVKFLADLRLPEDKTAEVTAFLQTALAAGTTQAGAFAGPPPDTSRASNGSGREVWSTIDPSLLRFGPGDEAAVEALRPEASERAVTRDAVRALINLIRLQERPEEVAATAATLVAHLGFLVDRQEFDVLELALQLVQEARTRSEAARASIDSELARVLTAGVLDRLVDAGLRAGDEASAAARNGLAAVREQAVPHVIRALEPDLDPARRAQVRALLAEICAGHTELIGASLPASSARLTRELVSVLGDLRDPAASQYLARLAGHPDYDVRREALDALRQMPSDQAHAARAAFLNDPDPRIQLALIEGAPAHHDARFVDWLQRVLRSPDWTASGVTVKVAALEAVRRMQAAEMLPLLRRIAGTWLVFGQGRRTVRDTARRILSTWERRR